MEMVVMDQELAMTMTMGIDTPWEVVSVDDEGVITIKASFARLRMALDSPQFALEYDSDSEEEVEGIGKMFADVFGAIVGAEFVTKMDSRGRFIDFEFDEEAMKKMKTVPGMEQMTSMFSAEGMKQLMGQGATFLRDETPDFGDTWEFKSETSNVAVGKQEMEIKYRYEGQEEIDGRMLGKIGMVMDLNIEEGDDDAGQIANAELEDYEGGGTLYFDVAAGRMSHSTIRQKMHMDVEAAGQFIEQDMTNDTTMTLKPAAEESDSESQP